MDIRGPARTLARMTFGAALLLFWSGAPALAGKDSWSCTYTGSDHKLKFIAPDGGAFSRDDNGRIKFNGVWSCRATVTNTDRIVILSGAGTQFVALYLDNGGFKPGFTNEVGTSDEIEISISLGGDSDSLSVYGNDSAADNIVIGKGSGFGALAKMNLNAGEATGIDADLTLVVGIEERIVLGRGGTDTISGAGGAGTGDPAEILLKLGGGNNGDEVTGGAVGDSIIGGNGPDVLKGAGGPDKIDSMDGVNGNDQILGGNGSDTCTFDSGDSITSCP